MLIHTNRFVSRKRKSSHFTASEVVAAIHVGWLKSVKATDEDDIRPEILKALKSEGILSLTRVKCVEVWQNTKRIVN